MRLTVLACAAAWCAVTVSVATASTTAAQLPTKFTNLQVLPKDIEPKALVLLMKSFAQGLGVRCEHCHVGEGNDLSKFDFATDEKPTKATARKMLRMMITINDEMLAGVGDPPAPGTRKVTCYTCHHGSTKPLTERPEGGGS
jgi:hypothetical protein